MLSGVSIICFAASYAVTLVLESTRLFFRSGIRGAVMLGFAGAGLFAHTVYLYYRAVGTAGAPLSSSQDWCLVAAWVLAAVYLYLNAYHPRTAFGLYVLPLVLGLIGVATFLADPRPYAREPASKVWGVIHGVSILLATVAVLVGFAAGLMYFAQVYRLKHKLPPRRGLRLPSLEWLQQTNSRTIGIALVMLGVGILSGMVLNLINHDPNCKRLPWSDPVVLATLVMFGWLAVCAAVGAFYKPAREGRNVAFLTMLSFVFLVIALAVVLSADTQHGGPRREGSEGSGENQAGAIPTLAWACSETATTPRTPTRPWPRPPRRTHILPRHEPTSMPAPYPILPAPYPILRTPYSPLSTLRTPYSPLSTPHSVLPTAYCPLSTAYCPLPTAYCPPSARRHQA